MRRRSATLAYRPAERELDLFVEMLSLPDEGPMDQDPRRVLKLAGVSAIEVVFRPDGVDGLLSRSAVVRLRLLDEVSTLFTTLAWAHSMYGWEFVDTEQFRDHWPATPSVTVGTGSRGVAHPLFWFTECGDEDGSYCLEGVAYFDAPAVGRANGTPVSVSGLTAVGPAGGRRSGSGTRV